MSRHSVFEPGREALADSAEIYGAPRQPDLTGYRLGRAGRLEVANGDTCCRNVHLDFVATPVRFNLDIVNATKTIKVQESY
jgi:hypothetical protein